MSRQTIKQESWEVVTGMVRETSFGVTDTADNVTINIEVKIFDDGYGCFEIYDVETGGEEWYAEGGLWFRGKELVDYDGVFDLSSYIKDKLRQWGYKL